MDIQVAPLAQVAPVDSNGKINITPTDVTAFIRLEQCERNLRLQLHTRNGGSNFWAKHNVAPQPIPPLLSLFGGGFEAEVEAGFSASGGAESFSQNYSLDGEFDTTHRAQRALLEGKCIGPIAQVGDSHRMP